MEGEKKKGVIYILQNPAFKEYVKIGYAQDLEERLRQLNRSETIPYAFRAYAVYEVNSTLTDKELHKLIDRLNPTLRTKEEFDGKPRVKEFYRMSLEEAYSILECIAKISGTIDCLKRTSPEGHKVICGDEDSKKDQAKQAEHIVYCKHKESKATGYWIEKTREFVLLAGSVLRVGERPSMPEVLVRKREKFIAEQCDIINGSPVLRTDYVTSSPSIAGALILGRNTNGWTKWKDADGKTLDEIYRQNNR